MVVGEEEEIFSNTLVIDNVNLLAIDKLEKSLEVSAKVRYAAKEAKAIIEPLNENKIKVTFFEMQRAITKGQSVVFYDGDIVIGGGKII